MTLQQPDAVGLSKKYSAPGLLVSVRNVGEAAIALESGADWIDIKEPSRGALGRADWSTIRDIVAHVGGRLPVSAALGELNTFSDDIVDACLQIDGLDLVKIGLGGITAADDWRHDWRCRVEPLCKKTSVAAAAYADWRIIGAPSPEEIIIEMSHSCRAILIDTFCKDGPATTDWIRPQELRQLTRSARAVGLVMVIAGRLGLESLPALQVARPDYVGVRGAVCQGARTDRIEGSLIRGFQSSLSQLRVA